MPIKVQCGSCQASLKAPDKAAGKSLPCPRCKQPIAVPDIDPLAALDQVSPKSEFGSVFDGLGTDDGHQELLGVPADPMGGMSGPGYGQPRGALPFGGQRAPLTQAKKQDDSHDSSTYAGIGGVVGLILAFIFMGLNMAVGGGRNEHVAKVEAARDRAQAQIDQLKRQAVNTPKPRNNSPLERFGSNNSSTTKRPEPGRSNNSGLGNDRGADDLGNFPPGDPDRGNGRPGGAGRGNGGRGNDVDRTPPEPINTNMTMNGAEPPLVDHSGETTESRYAVNFVVEGGTILMPLRPWMTTPGVQTSARLKALPRAGEEIELVTADGQDVSLAPNSLDAADRSYLARLIVALTKTLNNPAAGNVGEAGAAGFAPFSAMAKRKGIEPDAIKATSVSSTLNVSAPQERVIPLSMESLILSSDRSLAMIVGTREVGPPILNLVNLRRQQLIGTYRFPSASRGLPFGITSDDRTMFSFAPPFGTGPAQLDQWTLSGDRITPYLEVPLDESLGFGKSPRRGLRDGIAADEFFGVVNDETVFVQMAGQLVLIDMAGGEALFADAVDPDGPPGFSANRKYMAVQPHRSTSGAEDDVLIVDCLSLSIVGSFPAPSVRSLAFSEDGTKLAGIHNDDTIKIFDVVTGEQVDEFPLPFDSEMVYWSGNDYLFAVQNSRHTIISLPLGCPIARWNASGSAKPGLRVPLGNGRFLLGSQQPDGLNVSSAILPAAEWVPETADASPFYIQLAGQSFAIDVTATEFDDSQKAELTTAIEGWVTAGGGTVDANAKLKLVCKTRPGATQTLEFKRMETTLPMDVDYATSVCEISLYDDTSLIWQESDIFGGPTIVYGERRDVLSSVEGTNVPSIEFFREVKMPGRFARSDAWRDLPSY